MTKFVYLITLRSGEVSTARNGIDLDQLMADSDRWKDVKTIEPLPKDDPRLKA